MPGKTGTGFIESNDSITYSTGTDFCVAYSHTCSYCGQWVTDSQNHYCSGSDPKLSYSYTCLYCGQWVNCFEAHYCYGGAHSYWNVPLAELQDITLLLKEIRDLLIRDLLKKDE